MRRPWKFTKRVLSTSNRNFESERFVCSPLGVTRSTVQMFLTMKFISNPFLWKNYSFHHGFSKVTSLTSRDIKLEENVKCQRANGDIQVWTKVMKPINLLAEKPKNKLHATKDKRLKYCTGVGSAILRPELLQFSFELLLTPSPHDGFRIRYRSCKRRFW